AQAESWTLDRLRDLDREVVGPVEQFQCWDFSSVLRVTTRSGPVYFKASMVSPLFANEGPMMRLLSSWFPDLVPRPLAIDEERRWLLLDDLGDEVGWDAPHDDQVALIRAIAQMQIDSIPYTPEILAAGAIDRRLAWLADQAGVWLTFTRLTEF